MIDEFINIISSQSSISPEAIEKIKDAVRSNKAGLIQAACDTKLVSEIQVLKALSLIYSIPLVENINTENIDESWIDSVSKQFLKKFYIAPVIKSSKDAFIIINDPSDLSCTDDIAKLAKLEKYKLLLAPKNYILSLINTLYDHTGQSAQQLVDDIEDNDSFVIDDIEQTADLLDDTSDAPIIRLVNHMISQAVKAKASDIHVEPFQDVLKVRYRIDGILYEMLSPPKTVQASLISRIKVMAKMNIAEKRVPQDGRAQVRLGDQEIDIRISTVPTTFGERLVMRLLNKSGYFLKLSEFGLSKDYLKRVSEIIRLNNGIVLVTGPTGSGKTTTLYAWLSTINSPDKNIITIEDPVEYNLQGIGQIQVNAKTGVTFAKGLRSIVRQDPDIVLVGEIRDIETAEIAIQSALTGHLVFSTLHTNDAAGAITRLVDLGIESYLISSAVNTIVAQRLLRLLCQNCKQEHIISSSDIKVFNGTAQDLLGKKVYKPNGCPECFSTGYSGRQAIFEIMTLDDDIKTLVLETSDSNKIKEVAMEKGMTTLRQEGMKKVLEGNTSIREVLRVTQE